MTNSEIIMANSIFLMEQGMLRGIPGTSMKWSDEEGEREVLVPEEIATFDAWKKKGFIVKKGEHAVAKFAIWMPKKGKKKDSKSEAETEEENAGFYKKVAFFFTVEQVKPIKG